MLRSISKLLDYDLATVDGDPCRMVDIFFSEKTWKLKYLVVRPGRWLPRGQFLMTPADAKAVQDDEKLLRLSASTAQVRESPDISTEMPISLEAELILAKYWEWAPPSADEPLPPEISRSLASEASAEGKEMSEDAAKSRLRSFKEMEGYAIQATDGEIGHIEDLLCDESWNIRYAIVDTRNWLPGKRVILPIGEIGQIKWSEKALHIDLSCELIKKAPAYDSHDALSAADEEAISRHFARS